MKLLDRYLLKQFARNLILVLAVFLAIYLLVDFFERIDNFLDAGKDATLAVRYLLLKMPQIIEQLLPVAILLAGVVTLGLLNHSNELAALKAGGLAITRIVAPLIAGGLLCTGLALAMAQWLLPATTAAANRIWYEEVSKEPPKGIFRNGFYFYRGEEGIYSFARPAGATDRYTKFTYAAWDNERRLTWLLFAETATWQDNRWHFSRGQIRRQADRNDFTVEAFSELSVALPESPADLLLPAYQNTELSLGELFEAARSTGWSGNTEAWLDFHRRLSAIFLGLPLLLAGLPMLILLHQKWGRDLSLAIPASCGMAFAVWAAWGALDSLARAAYLHPLPAAWLVHVVVSWTGIALIRKLNR